MLLKRAACRRVPNKTEICNVSGKFYNIFGALIMTATVQLLPFANDLSLSESSRKRGKENKCIDCFPDLCDRTIYIYRMIEEIQSIYIHMGCVNLYLH